MTSAIDATKPVAGSPTTQSVRDNFAAAKSEIEALQAAGGDITSVVAGTGLSGGGTSGAVTLNLATPVSVANGGTGSATGAGLPYLSSSGNVTVGGNLTLTGNYVYLFSATGTVSAAGGTFLYGDANGMVAHLGNAAGGFYVQDQTGATKFSVVPSGLVTAGGNFQIGGVTQPTLNFFSGQFVGLNSPDSTGQSGAIIVGAAANPQTQSANTTHSWVNRGVTVQWAQFDTSGTKNISGAWLTLSDASVKQDIAPYTRGLDAILALDPVLFRYRAGTPFAEADEPSRPLMGLIAEQVRPHVPEIVGTTTAIIKEAEVTLDTLEPGNLMYALINAVKTLSERLERLEAGSAPTPAGEP